jgi:hypothetical protein
MIAVAVMTLEFTTFIIVAVVTPSFAEAYMKFPVMECESARELPCDVFGNV